MLAYCFVVKNDLAAEACRTIGREYFQKYSAIVVQLATRSDQHTGKDFRVIGFADMFGEIFLKLGLIAGNILAINLRSNFIDPIARPRSANLANNFSWTTEKRWELKKWCRSAKPV